MRKEAKIVIIGILVLLAAIGTYYGLTPQYKSMNMSGFNLEVPQSNANVVNNTPNYNSYTDTKNNLTIKTWSCQSLTDLNGSVEAGVDFAKQLMDNAGTNVSYKNMTLFNKSGTYTYYNVSPDSYCMIVITSDNLDVLEHIVKNLKQPKISYSAEEITNSNITVNLTNDTQTNDTNNTANTTQSTSKKTSTTTSKKKSSGNDGYHYSPQYGDYVKEYTDRDGVQHIDTKGGIKESYNPKTNVLTTRDSKGNTYHDYMG